ncbi:proton-conducting transporter transmembrane domain-containing protein [Tenuifilum sp.]|uniref:proton-conducting transporter transmembrane domain-containing protein n=1 Tax=Tenuifilum sp. TaxID=2760880 RepID=UPI002BBC05FE|nr:proton-conducting transporter membrane subunit [Tenuifilum sp.]
MVNPIHIVTIALGVAFALGFLGKREKLALGVVYTALAAMIAISAGWLSHFWGNATESVQIFTGGFKPPFAINLQMGLAESIFTLLINTVGLLGAIYLTKELLQAGKNMMIVFLVLVLGLNVMVMTRDLFNLFVFMEIQSIAIAGLVILNPDRKSIPAGFKYVIATGLISGLLLLGTVFIYYFGGTLNIDFISQASLLYVKGGYVAIFLVLLSIVLELKPFPANGWALDVYEGAHPGIGALISAASATAGIFVLDKLMVFGNFTLFNALSIIGAITFMASNLLGIKQENTRRLLGYSSVGQIGLIMTIIGLKPYLGENTKFIALAILLSHYLAKAGLFWLAGIVNVDKLKDWGAIRGHRIYLFLMGTFIFTLVGFPPFPSFFGKWQLVMQLASNHHFWLLAIILLGSLFEGVYLFRWLGYAIKWDEVEQNYPKIKLHQFIPTALFAGLTYALGFYFGEITGYKSTFIYMATAFIAFLYIVDFLPVYIKNTLAIGAMVLYYFSHQDTFHGLTSIFFIIFVIGGIITLLAGYAFKGKRTGFYPLVMMMFAGLIGLLEAKTTLEFFFAWELMTAGSYFLIIRGKKSMEHALSYILFSVGGAYLILAGFSIAQLGHTGMGLEILKDIHYYAPIAFTLMAIGFMTKLASIGLHIWLPGAHAEAEADVSPMVSAILLKAGVLGLVMLFLSMGPQKLFGIDVLYALSWVGVLTALMGNMMAAFQEDAKRLLAYSSIGVLGYALFGLTMMSHLGWLASLSIVVTHFMFKSLLFLAIGGVVMRTKTKYMYQMGGLIKQMPFSFVSVLIGIIVIAGLPPLTGFGGKWLMFNAIMQNGWYFQAGIAFFAGVISFLYCFRLIHTIFLGQPKDELRNVKEAPFWMLVPQYIIITVLLVLSALPNSMLKPIGQILLNYFPEGALVWHGQLAIGPFGYWNGKLILAIVVLIFGAVFAWLYIINRKAQKVKQFNIVYSAERPFRPETTHFAYNFYAPYKKAVGFLVAPGITNFWDAVGEGAHAIADKIRSIYNGNGQTYLVHILGFTVIVYILINGGF